MTLDEARNDPRFPELVARYREYLGPSSLQNPGWLAKRHLEEGKPCIHTFSIREDGWFERAFGEPEKKLDAASARDPKRDPKDGDVIHDGDGWSYTVDRFAPDEKGRSRVSYTVRWTHQGEAREEKRTAALGAWRHLWRQSEELRSSPKPVVAQKATTKASAYAAMTSAAHASADIRSKHGDDSPEHKAARAEVERLKAIWMAFPDEETCSGSSAIEGRAGAGPSLEAESTAPLSAEVARGNGRAPSLPTQRSLF